jgi:cytochrome P450
MKSLVDVDITSPDFIQDPYEDYDVMRHEAPVYRDPKTGLYVVTAYDLLKEVLGNPSVFSSVPDGDVWGIYSAHPDVVALYEREKGFRPLNTLVTSDPPNHLKYRKLVETALGAMSVRRMQESITGTVDKLIGRFAARGHCDFQQEFALRLPVAVVADLLGLSAADEPVIQRASDATVTIADARMITHQQLLDGHMVQIETQRHFQTIIDALRLQPVDSLLSHLIHAKSDIGEQLSDRELHSVLQALFVGGNDTTPAGIGNSMLLLCRNPAVQEELRGQSEKITRFVEEALRLESPVQGLYRFAKVDTELGDVKIPKGSAINVRYAAANRDEKMFPQPQQLDIDRKGLRNHMALGAGIHYCAGANLARLEIKVSVERLLARLQHIRLANPREPVRYVEKLAVRGFLKLPIVFEQLAG